MKFLPNIVHMSSELQKRIPGASSNGIPPRLIQADSHTHPFHFHVIFLNFHGPFYFLSHPNMCFSAHTEIGIFSMYRDCRTWKMHRNPCTYTTVLRTVTYRAANKVFKGKDWSKAWFFMQDGARVERKRTWWCWGSCARWSHGPTSITGMWPIQVLVSWQHEGQTKTPANASGLLGSRIWVFFILTECHSV